MPAGFWARVGAGVVERLEGVGAGFWKKPGRRGEAIRGGARPKVPVVKTGRWGGGAAGRLAERAFATLKMVC